MSSCMKIENAQWFLVEWKSGGRNVVFIRSVLSSVNEELIPGDVMTVRRRGEEEAATLIAKGDREDLDKMLREMEKMEEAGPSKKEEVEVDGEDGFSSSASSWAPSDDEGALSGDSIEIVNERKPKFEKSLRRYSNRRSSKSITPSKRTTSATPKMIKQLRNISIVNRKTAHNASIDEKRNISGRSNVKNERGNEIDRMQVFNINKMFMVLFKLFKSLKPNGPSLVDDSTLEDVSFPLKDEDLDQTPYNQTVEEENEFEDYENDEEDLNRSDDNVLITNKYNNLPVKTERRKEVEKKEVEKDEWVPIGSGKTLIHQDQFRKVNWKSYTIATRTLLLAVFPRRILATHSLTGKRSPAFQNKPAKMCLDPKIISDVIMEITDRFHVRENLVRSIITTKCADECKMWKTRMNKKRSRKNDENVPAPQAAVNNMEE